MIFGSSSSTYLFVEEWRGRQERMGEERREEKGKGRGGREVSRRDRGDEREREEQRERGRGD